MRRKADFHRTTNGVQRQCVQTGAEGMRKVFGHLGKAKENVGDQTGEQRSQPAFRPDQGHGDLDLQCPGRLREKQRGNA